MTRQKNLGSAASAQVLLALRDGVEVYRRPTTSKIVGGNHGLTLKAVERKAQRGPEAKWQVVVASPLSTPIAFARAGRFDWRACPVPGAFREAA